MEPLVAARVALARVATEMVLLQPLGSKSITKEAVAQKSGIPQAALDAFGPELWAGWPMAFLTFSTPVVRPVGHLGHLDPYFVRARACLVASSVCQLQGETLRLYDWSQVPWTEPEATLELPLHCEYEVRKGQNQKWKDSNTTKRRVRRVPWATAKGASSSHSSRLARRLPKCGSHIWAQGRKSQNYIADGGETLGQSVGSDCCTATV